MPASKENCKTANSKRTPAEEAFKVVKKAKNSQESSKTRRSLKKSVDSNKSRVEQLISDSETSKASLTKSKPVNDVLGCSAGTKRKRGSEDVSKIEQKEKRVCHEGNSNNSKARGSTTSSQSSADIGQSELSDVIPPSSRHHSTSSSSSLSISSTTSTSSPGNDSSILAASSSASSAPSSAEKKSAPSGGMTAFMGNTLSQKRAAAAAAAQKAKAVQESTPCRKRRGDDDIQERLPKKRLLTAKPESRIKSDPKRKKQVTKAPKLKDRQPSTVKEANTSAEQPALVDEEIALVGLTNGRNACFANAALQVLNAALSKEMVDILRGQESIPELATQYEEALKYDNRASKKVCKLYEASILELCKDLEPQVLSGVLGQLLKDVRAAKHDVHDSKHQSVLSASSFRLMFALSSDSNKEYDGWSQRDATEYFGKIVELFTENRDQREVFGAKLQRHKRCLECDCSTIGGTHVTPTSHILVNGTTEIQNLLSSALEEVVEGSILCEDCKKVGDHILRNEIVSTFPRLVLGLIYPDERQKTIDLPKTGTFLDVGDRKYRVSAALVREAASAGTGHYKAVRLVGEEYWLLNDNETSILKSHKVSTLGRKFGRITTILLEQCRVDV